MNKKRWLLSAAIVILFVAGLVWYVDRADAAKTSVVTKIHNSPGDDCSYIELENGDTVTTFCFWTPPDKQTNYDVSIKVGDKVEYGVESDRQFVRRK